MWIIKYIEIYKLFHNHEYTMLYPGGNNNNTETYKVDVSNF